MIRYLSIVTAVAVCFGVSLSGAAPTSLPFVEDFEDDAPGALNLSGAWTVGDTSGAATVQSTNVLAGEDINGDAADGTQSLTADLCDLTLGILSGENATNAWFLVYSKPTPYNDAVAPTVPTNDAAAFYLNSSGAVKAMDGASWTTVKTAVPTDEWLAFAVQLDYINDVWNLFLSQDNTYGTVLTKLNSTPLGFGDNCTEAQLTEFTLQGVAALDAVAVQEDTKFQGKTNVVVKLIDLAPNELVQVGVFAHDYGITEDHLAAQLGEDIFGWLQNGDELTLFDTAARLFVRDSGEPDGWDNSLSGGLAENAAHVPAGSGVWVEKDTGNTDPYAAFMDYNTLATADKVVLGTGDGGNGMNLLSWDKPTTSGQLGVDAAGFDINNTGQMLDKLYIRVPSGKATTGLKRLYWDEDNDRWMDGANPSADTLAPGAVFWYYRGGSVGQGNWDLENAN